MVLGILKLYQKHFYFALGGLHVLAAGLGFFGYLPLLASGIYANVLRLLVGFFLLQSARHSESAMNFWGRVWGVLYAILAILGSTLPEGDILGYMTVGLTDNILHFVFALPFLFYGFRPPDHKPVTDHDAERAIELEKEHAAALAAIPEERKVRGSPVVDLRPKPPPPVPQSSVPRISDINPHN